MKMLLGVTALAGVFAAGVLLDGQQPARKNTVAVVSAEEHARTIDSMKPPKRKRPLVAVLGHNAGTETTDFLVPYGVLKSADVADVVAVAPEAGTIRLHPALAVEPESTLAAFDLRHAEGADYVIVAAMHPRDDSRVLEWLRQQSYKGAVIVGVCSGVQTLAAAGLLEDRRATSYWYDAEDLKDAYPRTTWVHNRRYVVDGNIVTTTGISASMPISLALVEAMAGPDRASAVARDLGVGSWNEAHDGNAFGFDLRTLGVALDNKLAFWNREPVALAMEDGIDEIGVAFAADAWSRTWREVVVSATVGGKPVRSLRGLILRPDADLGGLENSRRVALNRSAPAAELDQQLDAIQRRHGRTTAGFVATQLEYRKDAPHGH